MLISFLERGDALRQLSRSQMFDVEGAFTLYLLKAISFREAMVRCDNVLDDDQEDLHRLIKVRLSEMIEDADCNCKFKPAILRLASGDAVGFKSLSAPTSRTLEILNLAPKQVKARVKASVWPIGIIGPKHIKSLEMEHIKTIRPHARNHVMRKAKFITIGDGGKQQADLVTDLIIVALRTFRSYYPFLSGLHMNNTLRRSMTNRGRTLVKYNVASQRQRLVPNADGSVTVMESGAEFDLACNTIGWADDPTKAVGLNMDLQQIVEKGGDAAIVSSFMLNPTAQENFCLWLEKKIAKCIGSGDLSEAVRRSGYEYSYLLSKFLSLTQDGVEKALKQLRDLAA